MRRCLEKDQRRRLRDIGDARLEFDDAPVSVEAVDEGSARHISRSMLVAALTVTTGILLVGSAAWYMNRPDEVWRNPLADAQFGPLTDFRGAEESASISRDEQFVAFLSDEGGVFDAWIGQIGTGQFHNLTEGRTPELWNLRTRNITFIPDGSAVSIWARDGSTVVQWTVPTLGGPPRRFLDEVAELDWSPDGSQFAYHTNEPGDPVYVTARNERSGEVIFAAEPGRHNHFPIWSPDGRYIYVVHGLAQPQEMDIWRIPLTGGELEQITFHNSEVSYPVLLDERTLLYLTTDEEGAGPWLYTVDVEERVPRRVSVGVERYTSLAASGDGRRIVATVSKSSATLWRVPIGTDLVGESAVRRVSVPTVRGFSPRHGRDALVYLSSRGGPDGLWTVDDGTAIELWSGQDGRVVAGPAVEPGGHRIAFTIQRRGQTRLYLMNDDGTGVRPLAESLDVRGTPAWSPDARWITVAADLGSGPRLFVVSPDEDEPMLMVDEHALNPVWSPDGAYLVYEGEETGPSFPVRAVTPDGSPHALPELVLTRGARYSFVPEGDSLVVLKGEVRNRNFSLVDLHTGREQPLTDFGDTYTIQGFDLSPDGSEIVFDRIEQASDVILIELPDR